MGVHDLVKFGARHKSARVRAVTAFGVIWTLFFLTAVSLRTMDGNMGTTPGEVITRIIISLVLFIFIPLTPAYFYLESKRPKKCPSCGENISEINYYKLKSGNDAVCESCGNVIEG
jgi:hypothetical protein